MTRIKIERLEVRNGIHFYTQQPFTGVGFSIGQNREVLGIQIRDGLRTVPYHPVCAHGARMGLQIDLTGVLDAYQETFHDGKPFKGIGYVFSDDYCVYECCVVDGFVESEARWRKDGTMSFCHLDNSTFDESYSWHVSGVLESATISTQNSFHGNFSFNDRGMLLRMSMAGGFLRSLDQIQMESGLSPCPIPITTPDGLRSLRAAREVSMWGDDIDDEILGLMATSRVFEDVVRIDLSDIPNIRSLTCLSHKFVPKLGEVTFSDVKPAQIDIAEELIRARPELHVVFNKIEVDAKPAGRS